MSRGAPSQPQRRHHWPGSTTNARQRRTVRFESLTNDGKAETVESSKGVQSSAGEAGRRGNVRHVEVFQTSGVGNLHPGETLDPYPATDAPKNRATSTTPSSGKSHITSDTLGVSDQTPVGVFRTVSV